MAELTFTLLADEDAAPVLHNVEAAGLSRATAEAPELALDPASVAVLTGAAILAARFIVSVWERWRGGLRVDLGTTPATVERLREIPYGIVVILTLDDDVQIQVVDEPKEVVERILASVLSLGVDAASTDVLSSITQARSAEN